MIGNQNDSNMIGFQNDRNGKTTTMMINKVNTMTPRQNDLVVKKVKRIFVSCKMKLKFFWKPAIIIFH